MIYEFTKYELCFPPLSIKDISMGTTAPRLEHLAKLLGGSQSEVVSPPHLSEIVANRGTAFVLCIEFVIGGEHPGMGKG